MRKVLIGSTLGALVIAAAAIGAEALRAGCDNKTTEPGVFCTKCDRELFAKNVVDGKCPNDQTEVKKIEICVKKHYVCACPAGGCCADDKPAKGSCKCAKPLQEELSKAMVVYLCKGCGARSPVKELVKHDEAKDKGKTPDVVRTCELSPKFPHGTEKPK
jgi:hypothetical protein